MKPDRWVIVNQIKISEWFGHYNTGMVWFEEQNLKRIAGRTLNMLYW